MPERTRRFHQAGEKRGDDAALPGKAEIVELKDRGGAKLKQRDREFAGRVLAERRVGAIAADQHIVEAFAQREQLVLDFEDDVLHASVGRLENAADGVGLAGARRALNDGARADQLLGERNVGFLRGVGVSGHSAMLARPESPVKENITARKCAQDGTC